MNETVNKFLLAGDKFMSELHLKQPGFNYSAYGPFPRNKKRIEKFMQTGNTDFIYRDELDKVCFQHVMAYGKSKDLTKRTQSDKVSRDKTNCKWSKIWWLSKRTRFNGLQVFW